MPGHVFWEDGEVFLPSSTFQELIVLARQELPDPDDQDTLDGMATVGAFMPDAWEEPGRSRLVSAVARAAQRMIRDAEDGSFRERRPDALDSLGELLAELRRRHPNAVPQ